MIDTTEATAREIAKAAAWRAAEAMTLATCAALLAIAAIVLEAIR